MKTNGDMPIVLDPCYARSTPSPWEVTKRVAFYAWCLAFCLACWWLFVSLVMAPVLQAVFG